MEIISHRGYWKTLEERNTSVAFERSFALNLGTETDFRDYMGELFISHDIATSNSVNADDFLKLYKRYKSPGTLALNIKADGLQSKLKSLLSDNDITQYFVFDMSIPDTLGYIKQGVNFYSRQSEYEPEPVFYNECSGIWLDGFNSIWYTTDLIKEHINNKKRVAIVSSELHKRNNLELWTQLKEGNIHLVDDVILCTDMPEEAIKFYTVK